MYKSCLNDGYLKKKTFSVVSPLNVMNEVLDIFCEVAIKPNRCSSHTAETESYIFIGTYNFELNKQLVHICHISQNKQPGNCWEESTGCPHHVPSFHRRTWVISKFSRGTLHQVSYAHKVGKEVITMFQLSESLYKAGLSKLRPVGRMRSSAIFYF